jgi:hypothetical protein
MRKTLGEIEWESKEQTNLKSMDESTDEEEVGTTGLKGEGDKENSEAIMKKEGKKDLKERKRKRVLTEEDDEPKKESSENSGNGGSVQMREKNTQIVEIGAARPSSEGLDDNITPRLQILTLYANQSYEKQRQVFIRIEHSSPSSSVPIRRVILSTNIAEASVTLPNIRFVVDTLRAKQPSYDNLAAFGALTVEHVARQAARQRTGRAGREFAGECYRLDTEVNLLFFLLMFFFFFF